ncbi:MAG TPA: TetR/AcrR family transcriptional regulator [Acidimicrobiales bacterium]
MVRARQARSVETRTRLLDAAAAVIGTQGIDGASVDAIAEAAERTSGSLYGQFGSKEGLIVALLDESKDVVAARISADLATAASLDQHLVALWRNFADPPAEARDWVRLEHELWVWATRDGNEHARELLAARYRRELDALAGELATWIEQGLIEPPLPPGPLADALLAALLGLEMRHRLDPGTVREADVVRVLRALLGAVDQPPAAAGPAGPATVAAARSDTGGI